MAPVIVARLFASPLASGEDRKAKKVEKSSSDLGLSRAFSRLKLAGQKPPPPDPCCPALTEQDTAVCILKNLAQTDGLRFIGWVNCSRVCKAWRTALQVRDFCFVRLCGVRAVIASKLLHCPILFGTRQEGV